MLFILDKLLNTKEIRQYYLDNDCILFRKKDLVIN